MYKYSYRHVRRGRSISALGEENRRVRVIMRRLRVACALSLLGCRGLAAFPGGGRYGAPRARPGAARGKRPPRPPVGTGWSEGDGVDEGDDGDTEYLYGVTPVLAALAQRWRGMERLLLQARHDTRTRS